MKDKSESEEIKQLEVFLGGLIDTAESEIELHHLATRFYILSKVALMKSVESVEGEGNQMAMYQLKWEAMVDGAGKVMDVIVENKKEAEIDG